MKIAVAAYAVAILCFAVFEAKLFWWFTFSFQHDEAYVHGIAVIILWIAWLVGTSAVLFVMVDMVRDTIRK